MPELDRIVDVTISRQTTVPSVASFDNILIGAEFLTTDVTPNFTNRTRIYTSLTDIGTEFGTSHVVYLIATQIYAQNPSVSTVYVGRKLTGGEGSETWSAALAAMNAEDSNWYGFVAATRTLAEQQDAADWSESNKKLYGISTADPNVVDSTGDIAEYINTNSYDRSYAIYDPDSDLTATDDYPAASWMGVMFPKDPGSATWKFKTLTGNVPNGSSAAKPVLTGAQITALFGKKGNAYNLVAGVGITENGTVGSGEYIDIIRGIDWLEARIQQLVFTPLVNLDKVPFTNSGIQVINAQLKTALQEGIDKGLLASFTTTVPAIEDVSSTDKGNRELTGVTFTAILAGAIHKVTINGTVTL
jgi:hypothetical protein